MATSATPEKRRKTPVATGTVYDAVLWSNYALVYDEVLNVIPYRNLLLQLIEAAEITNDSRVFDGCSGTGNLLWALKQQNLTSAVTEVDYSEQMLAKAAEKEYEGEVDLVRVNLDEPVEAWGVTGQFDRFVFNNCLSFLNDPVEILTKAAKLATDDAILVASTPKPNPNITELLDEHLELSQNLGISREEALKRMMPKLQPIMKCNEDLLNQYGNSYHLPAMPQLRRWFEDAGWHVTTISTTYAGQNWLVVASKNR